MDVQLIDYTGAGHPDPYHAARLLVYAKATRLEQGLEARARIRMMNWPELSQEISYIAKSIPSSWEFVRYTWEITGITIATERQYGRTRTASIASQSQRAVDMSQFKDNLPSTVYEQGQAGSWAWAIKVIKEAYADMVGAGVPPQDARGILPMNAQTSLITQLNLRDFAGIVGKRQNLRAQGEHSEMVKLMAERVLAVHPWTQEFLYPEKLQTPALDSILARLRGSDAAVQHPEINDALKELDALKNTWEAKNDSA